MGTNVHLSLVRHLCVCPPLFFSSYKSKHKLDSLTYISEHHKTPFGRQLIHTGEKALWQAQKLIKNAYCDSRNHTLNPCNTFFNEKNTPEIH